MGQNGALTEVNASKGRKRHLLVDTLGLVLLACVHSAGIHDRLGGQRLVATAPAAELPRMELLWADAAYTGTFARWLETERGWKVEVPRHRDRQAWRYGLEERPPKGHLPGAAPAMGGRAHLRLALAVPASLQRLRAPHRP